MDTQKGAPAVRLPDFLQLVRTVALLIVVALLSLVWFFPSYFDFIAEPNLFLGITFVFAVINPVFSYFVPHLIRSRVFYSAYLYNILWALYIMAALYTMGGIGSYFGMLVVFPILTTAFDLEARATLILGVITEILFASLMIFDTRVIHSGSYYVGGLLLMLFIGIFSYYLYIIIKEGVREKFEKEEVRRKYFDLAEIDQAKTVFVTVTSHQLQTPLSELRWAINSILEKKQWDQEVEDILKRSNGSVARLVGIVKSLLETTQSGKTQVEYQRIPIDLLKMIDSIVQELKNLAAQNTVAVRVEAPPGDCIVKGDPDRLRSAFLNIIENAVKYSPHGTVAISFVKEPYDIKVSVTDTGIGISSQEQSHIFTRFFRASNAISLEPNETGVGLYITKYIIEKHYGTIDFVSELGKGTTFNVALPSSR